MTREETLEKALRDLGTEIDWLLPLDHEPNVCRADEGEECVCGSQERTLKLAELLAAADKAIEMRAPAPRPSEAPPGCPECGKTLGHTFECSRNTAPASMRSGRPSEAPAPPRPPRLGQLIEEFRRWAVNDLPEAREHEHTARAALIAAWDSRAAAQPAPCPRCGGDGWYEVTVTGMGHDPDGNPIPVPELGQERCEDCGGTGQAPAPGAGSAAPTREDGP